jgi:parvulin-like peptidyl-prolyl isomerase
MDLSRKPSLPLLGGIACLFALLIGGKSYWVDGILVRVNAQILTLGEFEDRYAQEKAALQATLPDGGEADFKKKLLESLLEEMLVLERARDLGFAVGKSDVDRALESIRQRNNFPDIDTVYQAAEQSGMTRASLHDKISRQILMERVMGAEVFPRRDVTEWELRQYYDKVKGDFTVTESHRLREIVLLSGPGLDERRAAVEKALKEGTPFEQVAERYSQSPTAPKGGDLGGLQPADLSADLQAALRGLQAGQSTPAVATAFGLQYIQLVEIVPAHPRPFEEVKDLLPDRMFREQYKESIETFVEGLKKRYNVVVHEELLAPPEPKPAPAGEPGADPGSKAPAPEAK